MTTKPKTIKTETKSEFDFIADGFGISKEMALLGRQLYGLSCAFEETGNQIMADKLFAMSEDASRLSEAAQRLVSVKINEDLKIAEQATGAVIGTAFAVLERDLRKAANE